MAVLNYLLHDFLSIKIGTRMINTMTTLTSVIQSVEPITETLFTTGVTVTCRFKNPALEPWL